MEFGVQGSSVLVSFARLRAPTLLATAFPWKLHKVPCDCLWSKPWRNSCNILASESQGNQNADKVLIISKHIFKVSGTSERTSSLLKMIYFCPFCYTPGNSPISKLHVMEDIDNTVSPLHTNKFHSEGMFISPTVAQWPVQERQETRVRFLGWEDSPGEENGNPLQYSCLGYSMHRGAWRVYSSWGCEESGMTENTLSFLQQN